MNNIDELIQENQSLKIKNQELEHKLQKYTNSEGHKRYYEKNKDIVKEKGKSYLHKLKEENPDKLKEYRRTAYLNRKSKLQNTTIENISNNENIFLEMANDLIINISCIMVLLFLFFMVPLTIYYIISLCKILTENLNTNELNFIWNLRKKITKDKLKYNFGENKFIGEKLNLNLFKIFIKSKFDIVNTIIALKF
jgi:hypothetical protein